MTFLSFLAMYAAAVMLSLSGWMILRHRRDSATHTAARTETVVEMRELRIATPADVREILQDPEVPPMVKGIVAQAAHDAGLCDCDTFDQDGQLTDTDVAWLESQRGER